VLAVLLLALPAVAAPVDSVESAIRRQDELAEKKETGKLLTEAKAAVSRADNAYSRYLLGRAFGICGELEKAREQFDWALEKDPACAYAFHGLGVYHILTRNLELAERQFENAIRQDARLTRARAELGKLHLAKGDRAAARRQFLKVLEYDPKNQEVRNLLAHQYLRDKQFDQAIQEFMVVLANEPGNVTARKGYALSLAFARKRTEAIAQFRKVIEKAPKDLESYLFMKNLLLDEGDNEGAIDVLTKMIAAAPEESSIRQEAAEEIKRIKEGKTGREKKITLPELLKKLDTEQGEKRREVMEFLVRLRITPPPKRMVQAVTDKDVAIRVLAVRNLGAVGGHTSVGLLAVLLAHPKDRDPDERVRGAVVGALTELASPASVPVLLEALDDESVYVFRLAVEGLRGLTGRSFVEDPGEPVTEKQREQLKADWRAYWRGPRAFSRKLDAVEVIGKIAMRSLARYLVELLADEDRPVARAAREAFRECTGVTLGEEGDLDTAEGRAKLSREAVLALKRPEAPKKAEEGGD
jgi:tetratricopeptide (TPR) repeat protein